MAHNINEENGRYSVVTAKEKPWHGLGVTLPGLFTAADALKHGGLDFRVEKRILQTRVGGNRITIPEKFATVRMDNRAVLGVVGRYYEVLQNADAFTFFDALTGGDEAIYESAGCLGRGETTFLTAKLPEYIKVPGDVVEMFVVLTNTHDGTKPLMAYFTPVKVVCNNTLNASLKRSHHKISLRHTKDIKANLHEAHKLLGMANSYRAELEAAFSVMSARRVSAREATELIHHAMLTPDEIKRLADGEMFSTRKQNVIDDIWDYYHSDSTLDGIRGTAFGVYNAITGYMQNVKEHRTMEAKMEGLVLCGYDWKTQQRAFEACVK